MQGVTDRKAKFTCVLVLYFPSGEILSAEGETLGEITTENSGKNGFGYDPIFYSYDLKKTFADATEEEKNSVSHRGRALYKMQKLIQERSEKL